MLTWMLYNAKKRALIVFILAFSISLNGQSKKQVRDSAAIVNLLNLERGVLLFQLNTEQKKITELNRLINSSEVSEKYKKKLRKQRDRALSIQEQFKDDLIVGLKENYKFSAYAIIYDTQNEKLKSNPREVNFIASSRPIDLANEFYILVKENKTKDSGMEALIFHDKEEVSLKYPFPYYYRINDVSKLLWSVFSPKSYYRRSANKIAKKMNDALFKLKSRIIWKEEK